MRATLLNGQTHDVHVTLVLEKASCLSTYFLEERFELKRLEVLADNPSAQNFTIPWVEDQFAEEFGVDFICGERELELKTMSLPSSMFEFDSELG